MAYSLIVACVLLFVGGLLDRTAAIARMPRRWIWASALVTTIVLSLAAPWRAAPEEVATLPGATFSTSQDDSQVGSASHALVGGVRRLLAARIETTPGVEALLTGIWLSTSLGLLIIWIAAHRALSRRRPTWRPATICGVTLSVAPDTGPAVIGLVSPQIVVPAWVLAFDERSLDLILRHEREHVRVRDVWLTHLVGVMLLLVPWNPFVWWMASRLRLAVEFDCDARVITSLDADDASGRAAYGELLLDVATRRSARTLLVTPALIESSSTLGRRIAAMFPNLVRFGPVKIIAAAGAALVLVIVAFAVRMPSPDESGGGATPSEAVAPVATLSVPPAQAAETGLPAAATDPPPTTRTPGAPVSNPPHGYASETPGLSSPVVLRQPKPSYTAEAMREKIQGTVVVEAVVGTDGRVRDARVTKSLDKEFGLDDQALKAAREWEFRPGTINGRPVAAAVTLELLFTIH